MYDTVQDASEPLSKQIDLKDHRRYEQHFFDVTAKASSKLRPEETLQRPIVMQESADSMDENVRWTTSMTDDDNFSSVGEKTPIVEMGTSLYTPQHHETNLASISPLTLSYHKTNKFQGDSANEEAVKTVSSPQLTDTTHMRTRFAPKLQSPVEDYDRRGMHQYSPNESKAKTNDEDIEILRSRLDSIRRERESTETYIENETPLPKASTQRNTVEIQNLFRLLDLERSASQRATVELNLLRHDQSAKRDHEERLSELQSHYVRQLEREQVYQQQVLLEQEVSRLRAMHERRALNISLREKMLSDAATEYLGIGKPSVAKVKPSYGLPQKTDDARNIELLKLYRMKDKYIYSSVETRGPDAICDHDSGFLTADGVFEHRDCLHELDRKSYRSLLYEPSSRNTRSNKSTSLYSHSNLSCDELTHAPNSEPSDAFLDSILCQAEQKARIFNASLEKVDSSHEDARLLGSKNADTFSLIAHLQQNSTLGRLAS